MLSGNQSRLHLNPFSFSCSPHILPLLSLIDHCNINFQVDILLALLVVSSALPKEALLLAIISVSVLYMVVKYVMCQ